LCKRLEHVASALDRVGMQIGWWSAAVLLVIVLLEVASRPLGLPYFFGSEFGSSLMAWITFFALSEVGRRREHISARFLVDLMPARVRRLIDAVFSGVFLFLYVILLFVIAVDLAATTTADGTRSQGIMRMPIAWPQYGMVVSLGIFALRSALTMAAEVAAAVTGRESTAAAPKAEAI